LTLDKGIKIGVGEHAARMFLSLADEHVAQPARCDVAHDGLDRDAQFARGLARSAQRLARGLTVGVREGERVIDPVGPVPIEIEGQTAFQQPSNFCANRVHHWDRLQQKVARGKRLC
jgi:hypothetical protein